MPPGQGKVKDEGDPGNITTNGAIRVKWYPADRKVQKETREFVNSDGITKGTIVLFDLADSDSTTLATNVKKKK